MRRIWSALKFATPTARALPDFTASTRPSANTPTSVKGSGFRNHPLVSMTLMMVSGFRQIRIFRTESVLSRPDSARRMRQPELLQNLPIGAAAMRLYVVRYGGLRIRAGEQIETWCKLRTKFQPSFLEVTAAMSPSEKRVRDDRVLLDLLADNRRRFVVPVGDFSSKDTFPDEVNGGTPATDDPIPFQPL